MSSICSTYLSLSRKQSSCKITAQLHSSYIGHCTQTVSYYQLKCSITFLGHYADVDVIYVIMLYDFLQLSYPGNKVL